MEEQEKQVAAQAALKYLKPEIILGVGSGSTVHYFIQALRQVNFPLTLVASSLQTELALKQRGYEVTPCNSVERIDLYVDGADEIDPNFCMIKGGGKALTGEKILASMSRQFICIAQQKKRVNRLGNFPVPIEVIPLARSKVAREIVKMGGNPVYRVGEVTDYGNVLLDVWNWQITNPKQLETDLNQIAGVVTNGIFAKQRADILILGKLDQVEIYSNLSQIKLVDLDLHKKAKVVNLMNLDIKESKRLADLGLTIGTEIEVLHKASFGGPLELKVRGSSLAVSFKIAEQIIVELQVNE